jgi:hypothetical protein
MSKPITDIEIALQDELGDLFIKLLDECGNDAGEVARKSMPEDADFAAIIAKYGPLPAGASTVERARRYRLAVERKIMRMATN